MSIGSYTLKIKELCDFFGSMNVNINDIEMVQICLGVLAPQFGAIRSAVLARENPPSFDLHSMLQVEENLVQTRSNVQEGHMLYSKSDGGRGENRGRRCRLAQGRPNQEQPREHHFYYRQDVAKMRGGAIISGHVDKTTPSSADTVIVANLGTTRQCVGSRTNRFYPSSYRSHFEQVQQTSIRNQTNSGSKPTRTISGEPTGCTPLRFVVNSEPSLTNRNRIRWHQHPAHRR